MIRDQGIGAFDLQMNIFGNKLLLLVPGKCSGQQPGFAEDLETIANTPDLTSIIGKSYNRLHDRRKLGDGAGPQVIPIGKATRQYNTIFFRKSFNRRLFVPQFPDISAQHRAQHVHHIIITIGTGEDDNAKFHVNEELIVPQKYEFRGGTASN
jgi:hypothetical protein